MNSGDATFLGIFFSISSVFLTRQIALAGSSHRISAGYVDEPFSFFFNFSFLKGLFLFTSLF